jgi:hypothetical protein
VAAANLGATYANRIKHFDARRDFGYGAHLRFRLDER